MSAFNFKLHCCFFYRINTDLTFVAAFTFKFNTAFDSSVNSVILTHTNIVAGMESGTTLAYDNAAGSYQLAFVSFSAQTLSIGITTIVRATGTFFMSINCRISLNIAIHLLYV